MMDVDIGGRIRLLREKQGLSQNQLAKNAKISQAGLSALESTTKSPSIDTLAKIADALGTTVTYLIDGTTISAASEKSGLDPDVQILARNIQKLEGRDKELIKNIIDTMRKKGREALLKDE